MKWECVLQVFGAKQRRVDCGRAGGTVPFQVVMQKPWRSELEQKRRVNLGLPNADPNDDENDNGEEERASGPMLSLPRK